MQNFALRPASTANYRRLYPASYERRYQFAYFNDLRRVHLKNKEANRTPNKRMNKHHGAWR